jgi:hypothetical protein
MLRGRCCIRHSVRLEGIHGCLRNVPGDYDLDSDDDDNVADNHGTNCTNTDDATTDSRLLRVCERCVFILASWKPTAMCRRHLSWHWHFYAWHRRPVLPDDKSHNHNNDEDNIHHDKTDDNQSNTSSDADTRTNDAVRWHVPVGERVSVLTHRRV